MTLIEQQAQRTRSRKGYEMNNEDPKSAFAPPTGSVTDSRFVYDPDSGYVRDTALDDDCDGAWLTTAEEVYFSMCAALDDALAGAAEWERRYRDLLARMESQNDKMSGRGEEAK